MANDAEPAPRLLSKLGDRGNGEQLRCTAPALAWSDGEGANIAAGSTFPPILSFSLALGTLGDLVFNVDGTLAVKAERESAPPPSPKRLDWSVGWTLIEPNSSDKDLTVCGPGELISML
jgi:hypothetical protein